MHRWSLGMDKEFHPTLDNGCNHFSMLALKLTHVSKRGPRQSMVWDNTITFHPITHIRHRSRLSLYKSDLCLLKLLLCLASDRLDSQSEAMLKNSYSQIWIWTSHTSHYKNRVIGQFPLPHTVPSLRWDTGIHRFKNTTKQLFHNVRESRCYCTFQHILADVIIMIHLEFILNQSDWTHCPACRTTLVATRFRVAVICPIIQVPDCIRVFFYFVWFVFINHIFQFYYELCTYCNILDIYLS